VVAAARCCLHFSLFFSLVVVFQLAHVCILECK
jgi:hypothetical protein